MADDFADVIVVGGGVAGLAAADALIARGRSVLLVEGRERLGGRIDTRHDPAWPAPIERGAEFVHGKPPEILGIADTPGSACTLYEVADKHRVVRGGKIAEPEDGFFEEVEKVMALVNRATPQRDLSFDECLARYGKSVPAEKKQWARMYVEGFNASDAREVSSAWLAHEQKAADKIEGDRLFRVVGGYDRVVAHLARPLLGAREKARLLLATPVRQIDWSGPRIRVHAMHSDVPRILEARQVIVTVPLGVLQAAPGAEGALTFVPELPAEKRQALEQLRMGNVVKLLLRFRETFWEKRWPDLAFMHRAPGPFPTWWTTLPLRTPMLTGWSGGVAADALTGKSESAILAEGLKSLSKLLRVPPRKLRGQLASTAVCEWRRDPFSRGAYSYARVGGADAAKHLRRPLAGRLFFAGEATAQGQTGTVAGAIASGRRVAGEILE